MRSLGLFGPLVVVAVVLSVLAVAYVAAGGRPSDEALILWQFCNGTAVVVGLVDDASRRHRVPCYEFGFLLAVFLPVSLAWYLVWSRGWRGLAYLFAVIGLALAPSICSMIAWLILNRAP